MFRWKDSPDRSTPITADNLNIMVEQIEQNASDITTNKAGISENKSGLAGALTRILGLENKVNRSAGSSAKPIWLNNGTFTASTTSLGSTTKPVYMSNGQFYECTDYANANVKKATTSDKATSLSAQRVGKGIGVTTYNRIPSNGFRTFSVNIPIEETSEYVEDYVILGIEVPEKCLIGSFNMVVEGNVVVANATVYNTDGSYDITSGTVFFSLLKIREAK